MNSEDRQSFDAFMASVGAHPPAYHEAFAAAQREGHPRFENYLTPADGNAGELVQYRADHLAAFWDDQSRRHLAETLAAWLESPDSPGDAASRWGMLHRRLSSPVQLATFVERLPGSRRRVAAFDARLDNALAHLRNDRVQESAEILKPVTTRLYECAAALNLLR